MDGEEHAPHVAASADVKSTHDTNVAADAGARGRAFAPNREIAANRRGYEAPRRTIYTGTRFAYTATSARRP